MEKVNGVRLDAAGDNGSISIHAAGDLVNAGAASNMPRAFLTWMFKINICGKGKRMMRNYTTQMDAARRGIITPEMKAVAKKEYRTEEEIRELVAQGRVVICANRLHTCMDPNGVGSMLRTKINVNLGVSRDCKDYDLEMEKVMSAVDMGAEAIMDLSSHGNTQPFRRKLTAECPAMIGTVPVYDSVIHYQLSARPCHSDSEGFYRCGKASRRRWC